MSTEAKSWFSKWFSDPEPDYSGLRAKLIKEIELAAKIGDPFMIEKGYLPEYLEASGKREEIEKYITQAKINEAKKPKWDPSQNTCPYCKNSRL